MKPSAGSWHCVPDEGKPDMTLDVDGTDVANSTPGLWDYDDVEGVWVGRTISCAITFWEKDPIDPDELNFSALRTFPGSVPPKASETYLGTATKKP